MRLDRRGVDWLHYYRERKMLEISTEQFNRLVESIDKLGDRLDMQSAKIDALSIRIDAQSARIDKLGRDLTDMVSPPIDACCSSW
jgi:division protein CdvB (Snf7/Vps24/ESCRT-III family)